MNIFGWSQTILNSIGLRRDFLFSILSFNSLKHVKKNKTKSIFYFNLFFTIFFLIFFFPISVFLSIIESIIKKGGCIEVCAKLKK